MHVSVHFVSDYSASVCIDWRHAISLHICQRAALTLYGPQDSCAWSAPVDDEAVASAGADAPGDVSRVAQLVLTFDSGVR